MDNNSPLFRVPAHLIPHISMYQELGEALQFACTARFVNAVFVDRYEIWDILIQQNFLLTMSNPPVLPKSLRGRQMFDYLVEVDNRDLLLASKPMMLLVKQIKTCVANGESSDETHKLSFQRNVLLLAIEICQRNGGASYMAGNLYKLKMDATTLVPGTFVSRYQCPTKIEVDRSLVNDRYITIFRPNLYIVQASTNGSICLLKVRTGGNVTARESSEWYHDLVKRHNLIRHKFDDPDGIMIGPSAPNLSAVMLRRSEVACTKVYKQGDTWLPLNLANFANHYASMEWFALTGEVQETEEDESESEFDEEDAELYTIYD